MWGCWGRNIKDGSWVLAWAVGSPPETREPGKERETLTRAQDFQFPLWHIRSWKSPLSPNDRWNTKQTEKSREPSEQWEVQREPLSPELERQTGQYRESRLTRAESPVETSAKVGKPELCLPRGSTWTRMRLKVSKGDQSWGEGSLHFGEFRPQKPDQLAVNMGEKLPRVSIRGREIRTTLKYSKHSVLNKACPQKNYFTRARTIGFFQSPASLGKGNNQLQPTSAFHVGEGKYPTWAHSRHPVSRKECACVCVCVWHCEAVVRLTAQRHRLPKTLRPNHRTVRCFPSHSTSPPHKYMLLYPNSSYLVRHGHH